MKPNTKFDSIMSRYENMLSDHLSKKNIKHCDLLRKDYSLTIRVPEELYLKIIDKAKSLDISYSACVRLILEYALYDEL